MKWSKREEAYLMKYRDKKSTEEIARILNRTPNAVDHKANRMGLPRLICATDRLTMADVVRLTGLTKGTIGTKWREAGLKTHKVGVYRMVTQENLAKFMRENPNRWDWKRCDESYFGRYSWWQEIKRNDSNGFCRRRGALTDYEVSVIKMMRKQGKKYREIAAWIGRPVRTVVGVRDRERELRKVGESA